MLKKHQPATVSEISIAAALAAMAVSNLLVWQFAPLSTIFMLLCTLPFTLIGLRERLSISFLTIAIAVVLGFLIGGRILAQESCAIGLLGITVGYSEKKHWSLLKILCGGIGLGLGASLVVIITFTVLKDFRELTFALIRSFTKIISNFLDFLDMDQLSNLLQYISSLILSQWQVAVLIGVTSFVICSFYFVKRIYATPLAKVSQSIYIPQFSPGTDTDTDISPVPLSLYDIGYHYQQDKPLAPHNVTAQFDTHGLTVITGKNGSGKSTLAKIIAGLIKPSTGEIIHNGHIGLGKNHGTAMIFQRPESQVLGMRVRDDILFGSSTSDADVEHVLANVGLLPFADHDTAGLSGGQLQRLAIAAALNRKPQLLISDESTSMLDPHARNRTMDLFSQLSATTAIIHISHNQKETHYADAIINLSSSDTEDICPENPVNNPAYTPCPITGASIHISEINKAYLPGTPWENHALGPVTLAINSGDLVAITGVNGSGKSTLARILTGLEEPSSGHIFLNEELLNYRHKNSRRILTAVQHSASQLLAPTVAEELTAYAELDHQEQLYTLTLMKLPLNLLKRNPQTLSGGQQKRVVLASLFAAKPTVLILDEPLAGCDQESITAINQAIQRYSQLGMTIIVITHNIEGYGSIFTRQITLADGRIVEDTSPVNVEISDHKKTFQRYRSSKPQLSDLYGRCLPEITPARNLWVGTKLYVMAAITYALIIRTDWYVSTVIAFILLIWTILARVKLSALPHIKLRFIFFILLGELSVIFGSGGPSISIGAISISTVGLSRAGLFLFLSAAMIYSFLLFTFSTPVADIPPFLQRFITLPYLKSLCIGIALALRLLSLNSKEITTMRALATLRWNENNKTSVFLRLFVTELTISIRSCQLVMRRAGEIALTITARGGIDAIGGKDRNPRNIDIIVMLSITILLISAVIIRENI